MYKQQPVESFFNKSVRLANNGISLMGTAKGLYDGFKMISPAVLALM
jgi:hypothetical protein